MSEFIIRKLVEVDAEIYREIRLEMLEKHPESFGENFSNASQKDIDFYKSRIINSVIYGAFLGEKLVGVAGYYIPQEKAYQHKAMIWGVYVQEGYRGHKLSQNLILENLNDCKNFVEQAFLRVSAENIPAISVYKNVGFQEYGREPQSRKIGNKYFDELSMVKFLNDK